MNHKIWGTAEASLSPTSLSALRLKYLLSDLKRLDKGNVLEVGCGAGMFVRAVKEYRPELTLIGSDPDAKAIAKAKKAPGKVSYKVGGLYKLPFRAKTIDAVFSFDVFEHLEDPDKAFDEVHRVLKPKGLFHLYVPCEGNLYTIYGIAKMFGFIPKKRFAGHIQQYKTPDLMAMAKSHGFALERVYYSSHIFNQIIDFSYFIFLTLMDKETSRTVEGYIAEGKSRLLPLLLGLVKNALAVLFFVESTLFKNIPAHGVHMTLVRK